MRTRVVTVLDERPTPGLRLATAGLYARLRRAPRYLPQRQHREVVTLLDLIGEWLRTGELVALLTAVAVDRRARRPGDLRPGHCWLLAAQCLLCACWGLATGEPDDETASHLTPSALRPTCASCSSGGGAAFLEELRS